MLLTPAPVGAGVALAAPSAQLDAFTLQHVELRVGGAIAFASAVAVLLP